MIEYLPSALRERDRPGQQEVYSYLESQREHFDRKRHSALAQVLDTLGPRFLDDPVTASSLAELARAKRMSRDLLSDRLQALFAETRLERLSDYEDCPVPGDQWIKLRKRTEFVRHVADVAEEPLSVRLPAAGGDPLECLQWLLRGMLGKRPTIIHYLDPVDARLAIVFLKHLELLSPEIAEYFAVISRGETPDDVVSGTEVRGSYRILVDAEELAHGRALKEWAFLVSVDVMTLETSGRTFGGIYVAGAGGKVLEDFCSAMAEVSALLEVRYPQHRTFRRAQDLETALRLASGETEFFHEGGFPVFLHPEGSGADIGNRIAHVMPVQSVEAALSDPQFCSQCEVGVAGQWVTVPDGGAADVGIETGCLGYRMIGSGADARLYEPWAGIPSMPCPHGARYVGFPDPAYREELVREWRLDL